ncbi:leucine-rich repeat domain-containing protein, partial [Synergistaceae bacterium OttesenSCG-928-I11]|nr:leucine-rich repeat domain-containing protein [Synergistaceae bacterium OttesenSCG-928-I11]
MMKRFSGKWRKTGVVLCMTVLWALLATGAWAATHKIDAGDLVTKLTNEVFVAAFQDGDTIEITGAPIPIPEDWGGLRANNPNAWYAFGEFNDMLWEVWEGERGFHLKFSNGQIEIPDRAFYLEGGRLLSISAPDVTTVGDDAFAYNENLSSVSLPKAAEIGNEAFSYCLNLRLIELGATPPTMQGGLSTFLSEWEIKEGADRAVIVLVPDATKYTTKLLSEYFPAGSTVNTITQGPVALTVGDALKLELTGSLPENNTRVMQWQKQDGEAWKDIAGATGAAYTKASAEASDTGAYRLAFTTEAIKIARAADELEEEPQPEPVTQTATAYTSPINVTVEGKADSSVS